MQYIQYIYNIIVISPKSQMQWQGLNAGYMLKKNIYSKIYSKIQINHIVCIDFKIFH